MFLPTTSLRSVGVRPDSVITDKWICCHCFSELETFDEEKHSHLRPNCHVHSLFSFPEHPDIHCQGCGVEYKEPKGKKRYYAQAGPHHSVRNLFLVRFTQFPSATLCFTCYTMDNRRGENEAKWVKRNQTKPPTGMYADLTAAFESLEIPPRRR